MKLKRGYKIRIGLNESNDGRFCLTENHYYRVLDEYQDLIDKDHYVEILNDNGQKIIVKKIRFVRFEIITGSCFQKIISKQSRHLKKLL
jgi:hypothetical protein